MANDSVFLSIKPNKLSLLQNLLQYTRIKPATMIISCIFLILFVTMCLSLVSTGTTYIYLCTSIYCDFFLYKNFILYFIYQCVAIINFLTKTLSSMQTDLS